MSCPSSHKQSACSSIGLCAKIAHELTALPRIRIIQWHGNAASAKSAASYHLL